MLQPYILCGQGRGCPVLDPLLGPLTSRRPFWNDANLPTTKSKLSDVDSFRFVPEYQDLNLDALSRLDFFVMRWVLNSGMGDT
jgi:hypothetical protein